MATITPPTRHLRSELADILSSLRSRIRRYVALEGVALVLAALAGLIWLSLAIDYGYFSLTYLDLSVPFRIGFVVVGVTAIMVLACIVIALRLVRRLRPRALALVLERRFPQLDDRLILAVEHAEGLLKEEPGSLNEFMLTRACDDVTDVLKEIDLADVFDGRPLRRALLAAIVLWMPLILLPALQPNLFRTWRDGFIRFAPTYHLRATNLALTIIAPPDDRQRPISVGDSYKHPRGAGLVILLDVPETERPDGKPWEVPESAYARRRTDSGARQTIPALKTTDRQFRLTIEEVTESMDLWINGGDYATSVPYRIEVVDPPKVNRVELANLYPAHTFLNEVNSSGQPVPDSVRLSGPVASVPSGTWIEFQAHSNKPIRNARILLGENELFVGERMGPDGKPQPLSAELTLFETDEAEPRKVALPAAMAQKIIAADRNSLTIPLLVGSETVSLVDAKDIDRSDVPQQRSAIAVPNRTPVRLVFEDMDQVASLEPSSFEVRGVPDEPPTIKAQLRGVSNIITRNAVVPMQGTIRDDYGIAEAHFDFKIDTDEVWSQRELTNPPRTGVKEHVLQRDDQTKLEWLDTATLNLRLGQTLRVAIAASDGDQLTGPHQARGQEYEFTIVTAEELLATLYNQEINLRKRFEQSLSEIESVRDELATKSGEEPSSDESAAQSKALQRIADRAFAETQQHTGEVRAIESSFSDLLDQFVNNRVHTENQLDRIRTGIMEPLRRLADDEFPQLDRAVGELRVQIAEQEPTGEGIKQSITAADQVISTMKAALQEMQDLAEFHEAIQELTQILEAEEDLRDRTEQEQKESVIEGLGDLLD